MSLILTGTEKGITDDRHPNLGKLDLVGHKYRKIITVEYANVGKETENFQCTQRQRIHERMAGMSADR